MEFVCFLLVANDALKAFLHSRNPEQQHSATLESYLIKPIQRILKYPLLLQQLCHLTETDTDEHHHLSGITSVCNQSVMSPHQDRHRRTPPPVRYYV